MTTLTSAWTDAELDDSILRLALEFPDERLAVYSRTLEHCRRTTPYGTRESLLTAMRDALRLDAASQRTIGSPIVPSSHPPSTPPRKRSHGFKPRRLKNSETSAG